MKFPLLVGYAIVIVNAPLHAQAQINAPAIQIASAIAPLPQEFRDSATVLGYDAARAGLTVLRKGSGPYICLADDPSDDRLHVACYHKSLEPFMARGRALRAQKVTNVDSVRFAEIKRKKLAMPSHPAALYSMTGKLDMLDLSSGAVTGARPLYVVYIPFATAQSTGLPLKAEKGQPWIMFPGTAKAHIMFVPTM